MERKVARDDKSEKALETLHKALKEHDDKIRSIREKHGEYYANDVRSFPINKAENDTINEWYESLKPEILKIQKAQGSQDPFSEEPYYGAIGGGLTYSFTPTGIGHILTVTEATTGKTLSVTQALGFAFFG